MGYSPWPGEDSGAPWDHGAEVAPDRGAEAALDHGAGDALDAASSDAAPDQAAPDGGGPPTYSWFKRAGGVFDDLGYSVACGPGGNIFLSGFFQGTANFGGGDLTSAGGYDIFVASYTAAGKYRWAKHFGAEGHDRSYDMAVDASGNVTIIGNFVGAASLGGDTLKSAGGDDVFVASYTAAGLHRWSWCFGSTAADHGRGVSVDKSGNIFITGTIAGTVDLGGGGLTSAGSRDIFLASYTSKGAHRWSKRYGDTGTDVGRYLDTDSAGNLMATGSFSGTVDFGGGNLKSAGDLDVYVASYSTSGAHRWSRQCGGPLEDYGRAVAVAPNDNVIVAGRFEGTGSFGAVKLTSAGDHDIFVTSYSAAGAHNWSRRFGGPAYDYAQGVAVDASGGVLLTGEFAGAVNFGGGSLTSAGGSDLFVASYSAASAFRWARHFGDTSEDTGRAIAVGPSSDLLVTGQFSGAVDFGGGLVKSAGATDIFLLRLKK